MDRRFLVIFQITWLTFPFRFLIKDLLFNLCPCCPTFIVEQSVTSSCCFLFVSVRCTWQPLARAPFARWSCSALPVFLALFASLTRPIYRHSFFTLFGLMHFIHHRKCFVNFLSRLNLTHTHTCLHRQLPWTLHKLISICFLVFLLYWICTLCLLLPRSFSTETRLVDSICCHCRLFPNQLISSFSLIMFQSSIIALNLFIFTPKHSSCVSKAEPSPRLVYAQLLF